MDQVLVNGRSRLEHPNRTGVSHQGCHCSDLYVHTKKLSQG